MTVDIIECVVDVCVCADLVHVMWISQLHRMARVCVLVTNTLRSLLSSGSCFLVCLKVSKYFRKMLLVSSL
jgi:hypothetical protein